MITDVSEASNVKIYIDGDGVVMEVGTTKVWCSTIAGAEFIGIMYNMLQRAAVEDAKIAFISNHWEHIKEN